MTIVARVASAAVMTLMTLAVSPVGATASTPPGRLVVHRYIPAAKQADLFEIRPGGRTVRLTRTDAFESSATYSPDGRRIAFVRTSPDKRRSSLMTMRSDGTAVKQVAAGVGTGIEWSPDGAWITYVAFESDGMELHVVRPDGRVDTVVAAAEFIHHRIAWAPDSSAVAFSARMEPTSGDHDIYSVTPDGTALTRLTESPGSDDSPSFSPDGSRIVFSTTRDDAQSGEGAPGPYSSELYLMNADGSNEITLTQTPDTWDEFPEWAPQGDLIAFKRRYDDDVQTGPGWDVDVLVVDANTGEARALTVDRKADDYSPLWSPNARWVAFERRRPGNDSEVFVASTLTHDVRRLTSNANAEDSPSDWYIR